MKATDPILLCEVEKQSREYRTKEACGHFHTFERMKVFLSTFGHRWLEMQVDVPRYAM